MVLKIFLDLLGRQRERGSSVGEGYAKANRAYNDWFLQYGYQQIANKLHEVSLESPTKETNELETAATESSYPSFVDSSQANPI